MKFPKRFIFVGGRIVKTGIAVFVTALICHLLNWPAMFAVITAIVTIEPTASDSIKKAFVRFPATAIGTAYAVLFTFLFKDSAFTYAFVALSTIITCHKLKLHHGILVATLTGVVMITSIHDHYIASFFVRLGSTSTGLIVSTLVNLFVMPPKYSIPVTSGIHKLFKKAGTILDKRGMELLCVQPDDKELQVEFKKLVNDLDKIEILCQYQKDEWKFHRVPREDIRTYRHAYKKLTILRRLVHHIGILIYLPTAHLHLEPNKTDLILETIKSIHTVLEDANLSVREDILHNRRELATWLSKHRPPLYVDELKKDTHYSISTELTILYEILSISDLTINLSQVQSTQHRNQLPSKSLY